ncbi:MAG: NADH-quinone oxidoreductase subunit L [Agathobacter sp.]|nr:NADH-quinone oxidoreductase subunit L [Agathobacter sp.]
MWMIPFLICFPLVVAALMFLIRVNKVRNIIAYISASVIMIVTGLFFATWMGQGAPVMDLYYHTHTIDMIMLGGVWLLMFVITYLSFKYKKHIISLLSIVPTLMITYMELMGPEMAEIAHIHVDRLSMLMCVIIGLIGSLIVIYSVGYMHGYHHLHTEYEDRRHYFFMLLFVFLGAMFGFVLSESLLWIDLFWEMTSVCSFLLIGYTRTKEAITNSFRALWMNLLGGVGVVVAVMYTGYTTGNLSFHNLIALGTEGNAVAVIPVTLLAVAALTKAAQMPFSSWLMGAMVAPTPSSALLHSATMVKAGIYVLFRLGPAMSGTQTGLMISFIGGFTFFAASIMAIAQTDAKKVLAFSTVSNLGLMVACAGVGTAETIWAGVFLMIFHAISKSLLFQNVGATENALHSRDIEDMHGLIFRLPKLGAFMFIGIAGMFLAPFGMLISKWSALKASVDTSNIMLVLFIVYGSATTMFYWTKWMSKIISYTDTEIKVTDITKKDERLSLIVHAFLMIALCLLFPLLSVIYVEPLLTEMFGVATAVLPQGVLFLLIAIVCFIFIVPIMAFRYAETSKVRQLKSYMNGINVGNNKEFIDSMGEKKHLFMTNWYFAHDIGQRKLMRPCAFVTTAFLIVLLCMIIGGAL